MSVAVCIKRDRMRDYKRIQYFADHLAIGSQILDDFKDIEEDLKRRRFNYAINMIHRAGAKNSRKQRVTLKNVARTLLFTSVGTDLLAEVQKHFKRAFKTLEPFKMKEAKELSQAYHRSVNHMRDNLLHHRLKLVLVNKLR